MKAFTENFFTSSVTDFGTKANIVVIVDWKLLGTKTYSDTSLLGEPRLLSISPVRNELQINGITSISTFSVSLDDADGQLKTFIDVTQIEGSKVYVRLQLNDDWILLSTGYISGNSTWSEGQRILSFSVESSFKSSDVGYAPTLDDYSDLTPDASGVPWPLCFGSPINVPAHRIRKKTLGTLKYPLRFSGTTFSINKDNHWIPALSKDHIDLLSRIPDPDHPGQSKDVKNKIYVENSDKFPQNTTLKIVIDKVIFEGSFTSGIFNVTEFNVPEINTPIQFVARPLLKDDPDTKSKSVAYISGTPDLNRRFVYIDGTKIKVKENYVVNQIGNKIWLRYPTEVLLTSAHRITEAYNGINKYCVTDADSYHKAYVMIEDGKSGKYELANGPQDWYSSAREALTVGNKSFWRGVPSSEVTIFNNDPDIYIANLIESDEVYAVYGRVRGGKEDVKYVPIPQSWYEVRTSEGIVEGHHITGIFFDTPLATRPGQWFDDKVYVTLKSSVGPNSADILKFIFENYTDVQVDSGSYSLCRSQCQNFPCNFTLFTVQDATQTLAEIAFQSRIALVFDNGFVYMKTLFYAPSSYLTLAETDVLRKSIEHTSTTLGETIRKLVVRWLESYRPIEQDTTQYKARKDTCTFEATGYLTGNKIENLSCVLYNVKNLVQTMTNFWGYRKSHSWKIMTLKLFYTGAILQPMDGILISSSQAPEVMGVVQGVEVDLMNHEVTVSVWYPIVVGA